MKTFLALGVLCILSACGFRPVYGEAYQSERAAGTAALAQVEVSAGNSRRAQLFKAVLEDQLNPDAVPTQKTYRLDVVLEEQNIPLFVAPDGTYGRGNIQYTAKYALRRIDDNALLADGSLQSVSSYAASETDAIYASYVAQEDAKKRGVIELANNITLLLANRLNADSLEPLIKDEEEAE
jgi:LPS-assembly lipoprotein